MFINVFYSQWKTSAATELPTFIHLPRTKILICPDIGRLQETARACRPTWKRACQRTSRCRCSVRQSAYFVAVAGAKSSVSPQVISSTAAVPPSRVCTIGDTQKDVRRWCVLRSLRNETISSAMLSCQSLKGHSQIVLSEKSCLYLF